MVQETQALKSFKSFKKGLLIQVTKAVQFHLGLVFNWFDFHLSSFSGVVATFPVIPDYTFPGRRMLAVLIDTI